MQRTGRLHPTTAEDRCRLRGVSQNHIDGRGCSRDDKYINPSPFTLRGENMQTAQCDKKGRLELSQAVRSRYGEKFLVLEGRKS